MARLTLCQRVSALLRHQPGNLNATSFFIDNTGRNQSNNARASSSNCHDGLTMNTPQPRIDSVQPSISNAKSSLRILRMPVAGLEDQTSSKPMPTCFRNESRYRNGIRASSLGANHARRSSIELWGVKSARDCEPYACLVLKAPLAGDAFIRGFSCMYARLNDYVDGWRRALVLACRPVVCYLVRRLSDSNNLTPILAMPSALTPVAFCFVPNSKGLKVRHPC
jgi:hypothetical protein